VLILAAAQGGEGVEVGAQLGAGTGRREVVLAGRPERRWPLGCDGRVVVRVSRSLGGAYKS